MDPRSSLLKQKRDEMASRRFCDLILDSGPEIYDNTFLSWPKKVSYFWSLARKRTEEEEGEEEEGEEKKLIRKGMQIFGGRTWKALMRGPGW